MLAAQVEEWVGPPGMPGRGVAPANWHLTLHFLGPTDEVAYDRVCAAMDAAPLGSRFSVTVEGVGAFPNPRRATVLWLGITRGAERLDELAATVEEAVAEAGLPPEERPFRPHLTVSRLRPHQDVTPLIERGGVGPVAFGVGEVVLFRSHLQRGGPRYEPLERFPLR